MLRRPDRSPGVRFIEVNNKIRRRGSNGTFITEALQYLSYYPYKSVLCTQNTTFAIPLDTLTSATIKGVQQAP
jgi:hypothetical protein